MTDNERKRLKKSIQESRVFGARDNDYMQVQYADGWSVSFMSSSGERIEIPLSELNNHA